MPLFAYPPRVGTVATQPLPAVLWDLLANAMSRDALSASPRRYTLVHAVLDGIRYLNNQPPPPSSLPWLRRCSVCRRGECWPNGARRARGGSAKLANFLVRNVGNSSRRRVPSFPTRAPLLCPAPRTAPLIPPGGSLSRSSRLAQADSDNADIGSRRPPGQMVPMWRIPLVGYLTPRLVLPPNSFPNV